MLGRHAVEFVVPEDRERMVENIRLLLHEGVIRNHQYRGLRCDGSTFFGEISASVVKGTSSEPRSLMAVYQDITERKRAQDALRKTDAELLAAARIQAYLLPREAPRLEGFDIAGHCYPAAAAAGDHFDYRWRPDGSLLIVLADVAGHGLGPALVAADFCARLRTLAEVPCELLDLAERINAGLYQETAVELFVTAILGRLDPQARTITYINAGHPPAILLDADGREKGRLETGGLPFAILETTPYLADEPVKLDEGDTLFLYTDGLTEAHRPNQPQFGLDRALQVVRANRHRTAAEIIETVYDAVCAHHALEQPDDDITVVVIKVQQGVSAAAKMPTETNTGQSEPIAPGSLADVAAYASFTVTSSDDFLIIRFVDTKCFDTEQYAQLQRNLVDFVQRQHPLKLLIDLGNVEYCSTALVNGLLMAQRRMQERSGAMKLFALTDPVLESLQHLKLVDRIFSVHTDEASARAAF
jgi:serine phosphatase RsbU (regulator of sigma subunit)/anti-anti-sigma regulatory factor